MFTQTCTLTFPDGATVSARVSQECPEFDEPITYSGDVKRLPEQFEVGSAAFLRVFFQGLARTLGATYGESSEGEYERWAE